MLSDTDRRRLQRVAADRNSPQKHVWRARIVLLSANGVGTNAIMAETGTAKTTVWRWQERFMEGASKASYVIGRGRLVGRLLQMNGPETSLR